MAQRSCSEEGMLRGGGAPPITETPVTGRSKRPHFLFSFGQAGPEDPVQGAVSLRLGRDILSSTSGTDPLARSPIRVLLHALFFAIFSRFFILT